MATIKDLVTGDEENKLNSQHSGTGTLLFEKLPPHTCKRPRANWAAPGSVWMCDDCLKYWLRTGNEADDKSNHGDYYYWRPIRTGKAKRKVEKALALITEAERLKELRAAATDVVREVDIKIKTGQLALPSKTEAKPAASAVPDDEIIEIDAADIIPAKSSYQLQQEQARRSAERRSPIYDQD